MGNFLLIATFFVTAVTGMSATAMAAGDAEIRRGDLVLSAYHNSLPNKAEVLDVADGRVMTTKSYGVYLKMSNIERYHQESTVNTGSWYRRGEEIKTGDIVLSEYYKGLPAKAKVLDIANGRVLTTATHEIYLEAGNVQLYHKQNTAIVRVTTGGEKEVRIGDVVISRYFEDVPQQARILDIANGLLLTTNSAGIYLEANRIAVAGER